MPWHSALEAPHQPYSWLFVALDVLTGVLVLSIGFVQIKTPAMQRVLRWCVASYMVFGVLVMGAALSPLRCDPTLQACGRCCATRRCLFTACAASSRCYSCSSVSVGWCGRWCASASRGSLTSSWLWS